MFSAVYCIMQRWIHRMIKKFAAVFPFCPKIKMHQPKQNSTRPLFKSQSPCFVSVLPSLASSPYMLEETGEDSVVIWFGLK